jgi:hypothetical protein
MASFLSQSSLSGYRSLSSLITRATIALEFKPHIAIHSLSLSLSLHLTSVYRQEHQ